jgi:hypothetical protein
MPLEVRWLIKPSVTAFYAASLPGGDVVPGHALAAALAEPAAALRNACRTCQVDFDALIDQLMFQAADNAAPAGMAALALARAAGPAGSRHIDMFTPLVASLMRAVATPEAKSPDAKLAEELELRAGPLAEQWEARGPGLMRQLARLTEPEAVVARAAVLPVYPLAGGGGRALIAYNSVVIEAVLANPRFELPEVVRLAWLLAMLNFDLARYREPLENPGHVLPLAMIPPVLAAAAEVELTRFEQPSLALALSHWQPRAELRPDTAEALMAWWQTYVDSRPGWPMAVAALEEMLF